MIYSILRRNFIYSFSKNLCSPEECVAPFSLSVLYFSTLIERKSVENPALYELLLQKYKISAPVASNVASFLPQSKTPEKYDSMLSFLKEIGFARTHLEKLLKSYPQLLSAKLEKTVKPKVKIFQDMGFSSKVIADIISNDPRILHRNSADKLIPKLDLLRGLLGSNNEVALVLKNTQWVLGSDLEKNLLPNVEFLKSCGVSMERILTVYNFAPRFFLNRPEILRKYVDQVEELGVSRSSKMFLYVVAVVGKMTNGKWERKLQVFRDILQCSEDDILRMVRQTPMVFTVSEDKLMKVKALLLGTGKYTAACIIEWPQSLMYSIECRYKPRFEVLEILESRHLIETWPLLQPLCKMTDDVFHKKFVSPHLNEVGEVFLAHRARNTKRDEKLL